MDTKLLFVDSGAVAVHLSTELRGKDYFRSNFGNLAILAAIRPCLIAGKELGG